MSTTHGNPPEGLDCKNTPALGLEALLRWVVGSCTSAAGIACDKVTCTPCTDLLAPWQACAPSMRSIRPAMSSEYPHPEGQHSEEGAPCPWGVFEPISLVFVMAECLTRALCWQPRWG